jgi:uncharacterized protein
MMKLRFFSSFSFFSLFRGSISNNCSLTPVLLSGIAAAMLLMLPAPAQAVSFDCAKAQSKVEHLVCDNPTLSELDSKLGQDYQDVLSKANDEQKQRVIVEQKHWLKHTRDVCETETCLKHAYWSRQAALQTWFEPRSPLYEHESDKAEAIKQVLATAPLYKLTHSDPKFCGQVFDDLKQMKGIRLVDPVVQVQSYEDPALDPWKKQCRTAPPFNASVFCGRNIEATGADVEICHVGYGLPPFKLYELPPIGASGEKRHIFYADDAYGPMNRDTRKPEPGSGPAGFWQIHISKCLSAVGNEWGPPQKSEVSSWARMGVFADTGRRERIGKNYNSIFEYKSQYYFMFMVLDERHGGYWLEIAPVERKPFSCSWSPVKP